MRVQFCMIFHKEGRTVIIEAKTGQLDTLADIPSLVSCGQAMTDVAWMMVNYDLLNLDKVGTDARLTNQICMRVKRSSVRACPI